MVRRDLHLLSVAIILSVCMACSAGMKLQPGVVTAMADRYPEWIESEGTEHYPAGMRCSRGFAAGLNSQEEAVSSARNVALADLISEVVVGLSGTTEISQSAAYADGKTSEAGAISQQVQAKVRGRLQSARTVHKFWQKKVRYLRSGKVSEFDAWTLVCVPEEILKNAYADEVARSGKVTNTVKEAVGAQLSSLQGGTGSPIHAFSVYKQSLSELADLIDGGVSAGADMEQFRQALVNGTTFAVGEKRNAGEGEGLFYPLQALFRNQPLGGLTVQVESPCIANSPAAMMADINGIITLQVHPASRFDDCGLIMRPEGLQQLETKVVLEPEYQFATLATELSVSGYAVGSIRAGLASLPSNLIASHPAVRQEAGTGAARVARVVIRVKVRANTPTTFGRNLLRSHGTVHIQILLAGASASTLLEEHHAVAAVGAGEAQLAANVADNTEKLAIAALAKALGE